MYSRWRVTLQRGASLATHRMLLTMEKPSAVARSDAALGSCPAQEHYPSRLITIVVPITAGTTIDILARLYGEALSRRFGQQVVIANRPGAGGLIGAQAVASAAPDGYTVLLANSGHAILGTLNKNLPFDPVGDFCRGVPDRETRPAWSTSRHRWACAACASSSISPRQSPAASIMDRRVSAPRPISPAPISHLQTGHAARARALYRELDHHRRPPRRAHSGDLRAGGLHASAPAGWKAAGARQSQPTSRCANRSRCQPRSPPISITASPPGTDFLLRQRRRSGVASAARRHCRSWQGPGAAGQDPRSGIESTKYRARRLRPHIRKDMARLEPLLATIARSN